MAQTRRKYSRELKLRVLREIAAGKSPAAAAREHEVHPTMISQWRKTHAQYGEAAFAGNGSVYKDEARIAELERKIGQLVLENDLLKKVLAAAPASPPGPKVGKGAKR
jgi:transposase